MKGMLGYVIAMDPILAIIWQWSITIHHWDETCIERLNSPPRLGRTMPDYFATLVYTLWPHQSGYVTTAHPQEKSWMRVIIKGMKNKPPTSSIQNNANRDNKGYHMISLTFAEENLPGGGQLRQLHFQECFRLKPQCAKPNPYIESTIPVPCKPFVSICS